MKHKVKALALIADGTLDSAGNIIMKDGVCWKGFQIPVTLSAGGGVIGHAKPEWEGDKLYVQLTLYGESLKCHKVPPEIIQLLTPAVGGKILERTNKSVVKCQIDQIAQLVPMRMQGSNQLESRKNERFKCLDLKNVTLIAVKTASSVLLAKDL